MTTRRWLLAVAGLAAIAWTVTHVELPEIDPDAVAAEIRALGPLGPVVLLALLVLQCVVAPLPSEPLMMAAGFVYGPTGGFLLSWLGVVAGAVACFALARVLGRGFAARFVKQEKLSLLDSFDTPQAGTATFFTVLYLRLFAFTTFDLISYACGLIRFPFRWFLLATVVGGVPKIFAFTYLGANVAERPAWLAWMITGGTFGALFLVPWMVWSWRRARPGHSGAD